MAAVFDPNKENRVPDEHALHLSSGHNINPNIHLASVAAKLQQLKKAQNTAHDVGPLLGHSHQNADVHHQPQLLKKSASGGPPAASNLHSGQAKKHVKLEADYEFKVRELTKVIFHLPSQLSDLI